jgi:hypothetical protein
MKLTRTPLYRCAQRIHSEYLRRARSQANLRRQTLEDLRQSCKTICQRALSIRIAGQQGWSLAAAKLRGELPAEVQSAQQTAVEWLRQQSNPAVCVPSLALIVEELRQLQQEFEKADFDPGEGRIKAQTEPLVLEGITLGHFSIELHLERLARKPGSDCFGCVALEPNPAESNDSVTHPHVKDEDLCAGEATLPISLALEQGRLFDAFQLVASVLRTYNSGSPYVSLDDWEGRSCPECEDTCDIDDMSHCEGCDRNVCEDCMSCCDLCDQSCCRACLEHDSVSHKYCCKNCYHFCEGCSRIVDSDSFDDDKQLCPQCLAKHNQATQTHNPENHCDDSNNDANISANDAAANPAAPVAAA